MLTIIENKLRWWIVGFTWATSEQPVSNHKIQSCQVSDIFCLDLQRFQKLFSDGLGRTLMPGLPGLCLTLVHSVLRHSSGYDEVGTALLQAGGEKISQGYKGIHASAIFSCRLVGASACGNLWSCSCLCWNGTKEKGSFMIFQYRHHSVSISAGSVSIWTCSNLSSHSSAGGGHSLQYRMLEHAWAQWLQGMQKCFPNPSNPSCSQ